MPGPLPRWLTGCVCPLLPLSHRPSPKVHWVGSTTIPRSTTSERAELTRLQSVVDLQASEFACHPDRSHRWPPMWVPGRPWRLHPSRTRFVTSPRIGYANRPTTGNWRYGDLHPARLRPCRLLLSSIPPISRVEDWRASLGRCLCSPLSRPFVCECHIISTVPRFQSPPRQT